MVPFPTNILPFNTNILTRLTCADCLNYLSVSPVKLLNRKILCGRCVLKEDHNDDELQYSLYDSIAKFYVFKCVNHFNGCREFLAPEQVQVHEEDCEFQNVYDCPFCDFQGNGCQFLQHIKNNHVKHFVQHGRFLVNLDEQSNVPSHLIFHTSNNIFEIRMKLSSSNIEMWCQPMNHSSHFCRFKYYKVKITSKSQIEYLSQPLQFDSVGKEEINREAFKVPLEYILEMFNSNHLFCEIVIENGYEADHENFSNLTWNLRKKFLGWEEEISQLSRQNFANQITLEFSTQMVAAREEALLAKEKEMLARDCQLKETENILKEKSAFTNQFKVLKELLKYIFLYTFKCTNCKKDITQNRFHIYLCPLRHISCSSCVGDHLKTYCFECKKDTEWTSTRRLFEDLEFCCDWETCGIKTQYWDYFYHKQACDFRQFKCPLEQCEFVGTKAELSEHWHDEDNSLNLGKQFDFTLMSDSVIKNYWIIDDVNEMVCVTACWDDQDKNHLNLVVYENSVVFPYSFKLSLMFFSDDVYDACVELNQTGDCKKYSGTHPACADTFRLIASWN